MVADSFAKDSLGWQIQQTQQRVSEWLEFTFMNNTPDIPQGSLPEFPRWFGWGIFWLIFALALAWLLWAVGQLFLPDLQRWLDRGPALTGTIKPSEKTIGATEWLRRSRHWQQQGNYAEACRAIYMAMLEQLHDKDYVPRKLSRTDGAYLECVQQLAKPDPYQFLLQVHEQLCFGSTEISVETFERCQKAYQVIEQL
ncbi:MAG: DUF4129 domain-containing protein [Cyanobacteria bacterium P01_F01_bin.150]